MRDERVPAYVLVTVLALLLALWGAFLVPLHVGTVAVPVSVVLAGVGNLALCRAGGRLYGRPGALGPAVLWFVVVFALQYRRPEGDLVVPGTTMGLLFFGVGTLAAALGIAGTPRHR